MPKITFTIGVSWEGLSISKNLKISACTASRRPPSNYDQKHSIQSCRKNLWVCRLCPSASKGLESWILAVDLLAIVTRLQLWVRSEAVTGIDMTAEQVKVAREHCEWVPSATRIQTSSLLKAGVVPICTTSTSVLTGNTAGNIERLADSKIKS